VRIAPASLDDPERRAKLDRLIDRVRHRNKHLVPRSSDRETQSATGSCNSDNNRGVADFERDRGNGGTAAADGLVRSPTGTRDTGRTVCLSHPPRANAVE
jgi:hypothetical protein